jgi:hypothetical protein
LLFSTEFAGLFFCILLVVFCFSKLSYVCLFQHIVQTKFDLSPEPHSILETWRGAGDSAVPVRYALYDISRTSFGQRTVNVEVKYTEQLDTSNVIPPTLTAHRFQTG